MIRDDVRFAKDNFEFPKTQLELEVANAKIFENTIFDIIGQRKTLK